MIKNPNKIFRLLVVVGILFSIVQLCVGAASAADDAAGGTAKEWADKAYKASADKKYDEAISFADKAIRINPDYAGAYNVRGYARHQKKLYKEAIEDYDMTIKLKPDFHTAYVNRGSAKFYLGLYDGCIEDQNTAIKLSPDNGNAYFFRAKAYHGKKLYDEAIADYSRALEIEPSASRYNCRADAYLGKGERDLAVKDMKEAVLLDPKSDKLKQKLAKFEAKASDETPSGEAPAGDLSYAVAGEGKDSQKPDIKPRSQVEALMPPIGPDEISVVLMGPAMDEQEKMMRDYFSSPMYDYFLQAKNVFDVIPKLSGITRTTGKKIKYLILAGHGDPGASMPGFGISVPRASGMSRRPVISAEAFGTDQIDTGQWEIDYRRLNNARNTNLKHLAEDYSRNNAPEGKNKFETVEKKMAGIFEKLSAVNDITGIMAQDGVIIMFNCFSGIEGHRKFAGNLGRILFGTNSGKMLVHNTMIRVGRVPTRSEDDTAANMAFQTFAKFLSRVEEGYWRRGGEVFAWASFSEIPIEPVDYEPTPSVLYVSFKNPFLVVNEGAAVEIEPIVKGVNDSGAFDYNWYGACVGKAGPKCKLDIYDTAGKLLEGKVIVTDEKGRKGEATFYIYIQPILAGIKLSAKSPAAGSTVDASALVTEGKRPADTYWEWQAEGGLSPQQKYGDSIKIKVQGEGGELKARLISDDVLLGKGRVLAETSVTINPKEDKKDKEKAEKEKSELEHQAKDQADKEKAEKEKAEQEKKDKDEAKKDDVKKTSPPTPESISDVKSAMLAEIEAYLNQFKGTYFGEYISLGEIELFRKAADKRLRFIVGEEGNKLIKARGESKAYHHTWDYMGTITTANIVFPFDPRDLSKDHGKHFGQQQTMMHEMTHHLEWLSGVKTKEKPRSERNCDYQDQVINRLRMWVDVEKRIMERKSEPECQFKNWQSLWRDLRELEAGRVAGGIMPDPDLHAMNGFRAGFDDIRRAYLNGDCEELKKLAALPPNFEAPDVDECEKRQKKIAEKEKLEKEKAEQEKAEKERAQKERLAKEKKERDQQEKAELEKLAQERLAKEEREREQQEKAEQEKLTRVPQTTQSPQAHSALPPKKFSQLTEQERIDLFSCLCQCSCGGAPGCFYNAPVEKDDGGVLACPRVGKPPCMWGEWGCNYGYFPTSGECVENCYKSANVIFNPAESKRDLRAENRKRMKPLKVSFSPDTKPIRSQYGDIVKLTANVEEGIPGYTYSWSGNGEGKDNTFTFINTRKPGSYSVSVTVNDSYGSTVTASTTIVVEAITVKIEKTSPPADTVTVGGKAQFKAEVMSGTGPARGDFNFQWQPHPEIEFEPFEKSATTTATFRKPGTYSIYVQALMKDGERYTTIGESNGVTITVVNPSWKMEFNPPEPLIGQEVRAKISPDTGKDVSEPDMKEMNFRWQLPANARQKGTSSDDREITFYLTDDKSASISCLASTKYENENLGGAGKTIRAKAYNITINGPRPRQEFWMWKCETQLGGAPSCGMKKVENQFAVDQEILFSSKVEPVPEKPVTYNWTVNPEGCTFNSNGGSDTSITCRSTGSYTVKVTAKTDGMEIGFATAGVSVSISQDDITRSNKAKEAYEKLQKAKELVKEGKLDEGIQMADEASKLDPNNKEAATLANKWKSEKEKARAEGPLQQKNAQVQQLVNEGYELEQQGRLAEGIEKYKSALRLGPNPKLTERIAILERKIAEQKSGTPTGTPAMSGTQPVDLSIVGGKKAAPRVVKGVSIDDGSWIRFKSTDENRRSLDIPVPVPTRAAAVAVVSNLDDATYLEQGKTIARITVVKDTGDEVLDIQAGVHSSEWNYGVGPKHAWVKDADIGDSRFLVVLPLARPGLVKAIQVDYVETNAPKWYGHAPGFCLRGLSLVADTQGITLTPAGSSPASTSASTGVATGQAPDSGEQQVFSNDNIDGVGDDPTAATTFRTDKSWLVTYVMTYHYNGGRGQTPGAIGIRHEDGTMYGPWQASGRPNQGSQTNLYWECRPNVVINPGVYTVIDSHPASWSWNSKSGGGITIIKGVLQSSSQSPAKSPSSGQAGDARSVKAAARKDSGSKVGGQVKPVIATPPQSPQSPSTFPTEAAVPQASQPREMIKGSFTITQTLINPRFGDRTVTISGELSSDYVVVTPGPASGTFPGGPFNGLQITSYSIAGAQMEAPEDSTGFAMSRHYKGRLTDNALTVSGATTELYGNCNTDFGSFKVRLDASVTVNGMTKEYHSPEPCTQPAGTPKYVVNQGAGSFSLTIPLDSSAQSAATSEPSEEPKSVESKAPKVVLTPSSVAPMKVGDRSESGVIDSSSGDLEGTWAVPTDAPSLKREIYFSRNGTSYTGKIVIEEGFDVNSFQIGEVAVRVTRVGANVYKGEYLSILDGIRTWMSHTFAVKDDVFYVTDLVGQDDMDPTICRRKKSEAIPEAINVRVKKTSPSAVEEQIFSNNNIDGVWDGPTAATIFRTDRPCLITYVLTYHYNGGRGQTPGAIGLRHQDGTMYGPWQTSGRPDQGNQTNLYWECWPNVVIKPGVYTVIDSHPASWAWNPKSGGGITIIKGVLQPSSQSPAKAPSSGQAGDARSVKTAAREDSGSKVSGQVKPVIATTSQAPQSPSTLPTEAAFPQATVKPGEQLVFPSVELGFELAYKYKVWGVKNAGDGLDDTIKYKIVDENAAWKGLTYHHTITLEEMTGMPIGTIINPRGGSDGTSGASGTTMRKTGSEDYIITVDDKAENLISIEFSGRVDIPERAARNKFVFQNVPRRATIDLGPNAGIIYVFWLKGDEMKKFSTACEAGGEGDAFEWDEEKKDSVKVRGKSALTSAVWKDSFLLVTLSTITMEELQARAEKGLIDKQKVEDAFDKQLAPIIEKVKYTK